MPRSLATTPALAVLAALLATSDPASAVPRSRVDWTQTFDGWNRSSSPVIADIDADGDNEEDHHLTTVI